MWTESQEWDLSGRVQSVGLIGTSQSYMRILDPYKARLDGEWNEIVTKTERLFLNLKAYWQILTPSTTVVSY